MTFEALARDATVYVATAIELGALGVVAFAVLGSVAALARAFRGGFPADENTKAIRIRLAHWLALALELELAADIVLTAVAPSWDEIGKLAAIIALRTILNYFLEREVASAQKAGAGSRGSRIASDSG